MAARKHLVHKIAGKRRYKVLITSFKLVHRVSGPNFLKKKKEKKESKWKRLGAKIEKIGFEIAQGFELIKQFREDDARKRRGVDLMLDIIDAKDKRDFVKANNLFQLFCELMVPQNEK